MGFLTLIFYIGYNGSSVGADIWLAKWSTDEENGAENMTHSTLVFHFISDFRQFIHNAYACKLQGCIKSFVLLMVAVKYCSMIQG